MPSKQVVVGLFIFGNSGIINPSTSSKNKMPKKITSYIFALLVLVFSTCSWFAIDRAISVAEASDFVYPTLMFSLYALSLSLLIIFTKEWNFLSLIMLFSLLSALLFLQNMLHLAVLLVAFVLLLIGALFIRRDLENSLKIGVSKSLGAGMYEIILAIAIAICSQYYFSVSTLSARDLTPKFEANKITSEVVSFFLSRVNPQFEKSKGDNLTVDQFLGDVYQRLLEKQEIEMNKKIEQKKKEFSILTTGNSEISLDGMFAQIPDGTREEIMSVWKAELSSLAGYRITGNEKATEVLIAMINNKTAEFFGNVGNNGSGVNKIALLFSVGLFLAIVPFESFLSRIWVFLAWVVFWILRKLGAVKTENKRVEAEVLV